MNKNRKNIIIGGLLALVLVMAVGYAAFATNLNITGTSTIDSKWDVHIKDGGVTVKSSNKAGFICPRCRKNIAVKDNKFMKIMD